MQLNLKSGKTEMMIFAVSSARRSPLQVEHYFTLAGQQVRYLSQYR